MNKKQLLILPALFFALLLGSVAHSGVLQKGMEALEKRGYVAARKEFKPLAEQGNADAQLFLGVTYLHFNLDFTHDYTEALKWLTRSAEQGNAKAQLLLGSMYADGKGIAKDYILAYMWMSLGIENGDEAPMELRNLLSKEMTQAQIEKAKKLTGECEAKSYKNC